MPKIPPTTPKRLLRVLLKVGFYIHHQRGSHMNLRHLTKPHLHVVVPNHNRDLAPKTLRSILIQAEITPEEFVTLLRK